MQVSVLVSYVVSDFYSKLHFSADPLFGTIIFQPAHEMYWKPLFECDNAMKTVM